MTAAIPSDASRRQKAGKAALEKPFRGASFNGSSMEAAIIQHGPMNSRSLQYRMPT